MRFPGIIPALTTPFGADGAVDHAALERNAAALLDAGVHGFVATGTMGEAGSLSAQERREVIATVVRAAAGRVPVIAGVSSGTPEQSIAYAQDAAAAGAVAIMLLPPLGYRGDERETVAYFRAVAEGAGLPVMLYNNPEASGTDLPAALIARIAAEVEQVVAVKECSGDDWALEGLCSGATGWVSGVADCVPGDCVALYEACLAADLETARPIAQRLLPLSRLDMTPHLVQYFKAAQDALGLTGGPVRAPRLELDDAKRAILDEALAALRAPAPAPVAA